ncbi:MAG: site-specific tyrosine recombinase XerC [Candidatus Hydrogenedentes bacterium ADurb.Bin179]|nr:MAG: site-specific tyrosine recombinase XerC [Candidatus Hydrogenedentes bacterium ADurb.Bin179]
MLYKPTFKKSVPPAATRTTKRGIPHATWTGRNGRKISVEIRTNDRGEEYVLIPTATWYARYTDSQGRHIQRNTECIDKVAAQGVLHQWHGSTEKVKAGLIRAADEHKDRRKSNLIDTVLNEYAASLKQTGRTDRHIDYIKYVVGEIKTTANIHRIVDLTRRHVEVYLAALQDKGAGARTRNMHKALINGFCIFALRHGYLESNPAAYIESANQAVDRRLVRRALTDEEIVALLDAAERRPLANFMNENTGTVKKITPATIRKYNLMGRERRLIYETLLTTAARWGELRAVTVADCVLDGNAPHIRLQATATKNRRADTVPLTHDLAGKLKAWIKDSGRIGRARLFDMAGNGAKRFNQDLLFAGITKTDDDGTVIDVHALRHTAATRLARAGVPVSVAQRVLRHSDPKLTMSLYSHLGVLDTTAAVSSLPAWDAAPKAKAKAKRKA